MPKFGKYILAASVILLFSQNAFAAQEISDNSYFFSKGKTSYSSHFPGIIVWTLLEDENAKFIYHAEQGRVVVKATLMQSQDCDQEAGQVCFDGTVTDVSRPSYEVIKPGDTFRLTIDPTEKNELISFLSGFLEKVDVKISLQKTRTNL